MLQSSPKILSVAHFVFVFTNCNNLYDKKAENDIGCWKLTVLFYVMVVIFFVKFLYINKSY